MLPDTARQLLKVVGFPDFQIEKLIDTKVEEVKDDYVINLISIHMNGIARDREMLRHSLINNINSAFGVNKG